MFNLPQILALAGETSTSAITLSPETVYIILACTGLLEDQSNWEGAGDELTDAERDQIDALVAQLVSEVMP